MGGAIAMKYAKANTLVKQLILFAPAGLTTIPPSFSVKLITTPFVGTW